MRTGRCPLNQQSAVPLSQGRAETRTSSFRRSLLMQKPKASMRLCFCVCFEYTTRLYEAVDHKDDDDDDVFVVHDGFASGFVVYGGGFRSARGERLICNSYMYGTSLLAKFVFIIIHRTQIPRQKHIGTPRCLVLVCFVLYVVRYAIYNSRRLCVCVFRFSTAQGST